MRWITIDTKNTEESLLKYAQEKFYSAMVDAIEAYNRSILMADFLNTVNAAFYKETRVHLTPDAHIPNRSKGFSSFKKNVKKELKDNFYSIPSENCTKEDIDKAVENFKNEVFKDILGATLTLHTNSDFTQYCENTDDPELKKLYIQNKAITRYLNSNTKPKKRINMSDAFIDDDPELKKVSPKIKALDIENISSEKDYYDQLIALLTLLTNLSMFGRPHQSGKRKEKSVKSSKKQRIISEIDYPIYDIINLISKY